MSLNLEFTACLENRRYFGCMHVIDSLLKERMGNSLAFGLVVEIIDVEYTELVRAPVKELTHPCNRIGVKCSNDCLVAWASIIWKSNHYTHLYDVRHLRKDWAHVAHQQVCDEHEANE